MSNFRRWFVPGGTFFFTVVTYGRKRFLTSAPSRKFLRKAIETVRERHPVNLLAFVLLPDHLHTLWILPPGDARYDLRWKRIKEEFTKAWREMGGPESPVTDSQRFRGERGVWQPRYWEHTILDEEDLEAHFDYIHWNPGKHGLVKDVADWKWSSFHRYRKLGHYTPGWGSIEPTSSQHIQDFGEPS